MKWLLIIVGTLAGVVVLVTLIGVLLPQKHTAARAAHFRESPEIIWQTITDYEKFPEWRPSVKRIQPLSPRNGRPAWSEVDNHGQTIAFEIDEWRPPVRLVSRIASRKLPFGGTWTYEITPAGTGCTLRITENGEVYNPIFRFVSRFVLGYRGTMDVYLRALGAKFGETVELKD